MPEFEVASTVGFDWIAKRLVMGRPGSVIRQVSLVKRHQILTKKPDEVEQMLPCED